jgi:hypothetical protein
MDSRLTEHPKSLTELPSDTSVKLRFEGLSSPELSTYMKTEETEVSQRATKVAQIFGTAYLCGEKDQQ